ncbi:MAG: hypothetical protein Barrevirus19_4 [Barrevirus sp.]|uniref:Uncharacterized protein n=1 Tax=Barrevirus sp. TaxID=2487763 RepID=A0A3G4ZUV6_9VIRU|nr:MAG: hypothetical protein Barrevirus19_4 [Barrevirus sp.]
MKSNETTLLAYQYINGKIFLYKIKLFGSLINMTMDIFLGKLM